MTPQPTLAEINAMSKEELKTFNQKLYKRAAVTIIGSVFFKLAAPKVAVLLLTKAVISAAKRA